LSPAPTRDRALRERLDARAAHRPLVLHRFLRRYDPVAAARIHANDHQKLIRAIELTLLAAQPASQTQNAPRDPLRGSATLKLGLSPERHLLYDRLNQRCCRMFEQGLLAETEALLGAGFSPDLKALQSLGYKQALQHLSGNLSYKDAVVECQTRTRQYAKRQLTWFRREPNVEWLAGFGTEGSVQQTALELSSRFLAAHPTG
jgi:tRNA dimethylallyltransferase